MKKLQNNFTTPEQSRRLLELCVPADSADMLWDGYTDVCDGWMFEDFPKYTNKPYSYYKRLYREMDAANILPILPCWSVGRLMEIIGLCAIFPPHGSSILFHDERDYIESLVYRIEKHIEWFDFSKLEE